MSLGCTHAWDDPEGSFLNYQRCRNCGGMRRLDNPDVFVPASKLCPECMCANGAPHYVTCSRFGQPPQPTAYDRAQAELKESIGHNRSVMIQGLADLENRLDAALRRIEQLEREVARLKGPQRWEEPPCPFLPCGCPAGSNTHKADCHHVHQKIYGQALYKLGLDANGSPLPDEGT